MIVTIIFGVIIAAFALYHAVRSIKGSKKHRIMLVNIILAAVAVVCGVIIAVNTSVIESARSEYNVHNSTILGGVYFEKEQDGYYFFSSHTLFSSDEYVVSTDDVKLPWISRLVGEVAVCTSNSRSHGYSQVEINGSKYTLWDNAEKIIPDFSFMLTYFIVLTALVAAIFDIAMLITYLKNRKQKGAASPHEDEEKKES
ncbi:hypothetical protein [Ruminococcus sp. FC2018]|uniref:hypothetical protein n=1 Tax=Ruminococcus sp. FC2018 TaxID=1410617 RepID=UPI00048C79E1|nr:hypothetical protein [Ruminococcus sp. FC2018]